MTGLWLSLMLGCGGGTDTATAVPAAPDKPAAPKKAKTGKTAKQKKPVDVAKVPAKVFYVDSAAFAEGRKPYLVAVDRQIGAKTPPKNSVWMLFQGPTQEEKAKGLELVRSGSEGFEDFKLTDGVASLKLRGGCESGGATLTVYDLIHETLLQYEQIKFVKVFDPEGKTTVPDGQSDSRPACLEP